MNFTNMNFINNALYGVARHSSYMIKPLYAIHSVFILKENILFLEQWIDYHIQLGFNKFYLYDNSKVTRSGGFHKKHAHFKEGRVNKYNVNYGSIVKLDDLQLQKLVKQIENKYKCVDIVEWSPKDKDGNILFNQKEAHNHCLKRMKTSGVLWCANIDMDEYIVLKNHTNIQEYIKSLNTNIYNISMCQHRFDSRFNNIDKLVINITKKSIVPANYSNKNLYNVSKTLLLDIHDWFGVGKQIIGNMEEIWFNHYKINIVDENFIDCDNIHPIIKSIIIKNSNNYLKL